MRSGSNSEHKLNLGPLSLSVLQDFGVPPSATLLEDASRNTRENATMTAALLRQRGIDKILLVTSALHMERARRYFVVEGLSVEPAPTDFEAVPEVEGVLRFLPDAESLLGSARAFKELVGQLAAGITRFKGQGAIELGNRGHDFQHARRCLSG
jgi:uncharacterized SAM-binding protein YcdF (DUF218 family)